MKKQLLARMVEIERRFQDNRRYAQFISIAIMLFYIAADFFGAVEYVVAQRHDVPDSRTDNSLLFLLTMFDVVWFGTLTLYNCIVGYRRASVLRHLFGFAQIWLVTQRWHTFWTRLFWPYKCIVGLKILSV